MGNACLTSNSLFSHLAKMPNQPTALNLTEEVSQFMKRRFASLTTNASQTMQYPDHWDLRLFVDCQMAVKAMAEAARNQSADQLDSLLFDLF